MGATVTARKGWLILRLWWQNQRRPEATGLRDTAKNREDLARFCGLVNAELKAKQFTAERYLHYFPRGNRAAEIRAALGYEVAAAAIPTFEKYAAKWLNRQTVKAKRLKELRTAITRLSATELDGVRIGNMHLRAVTPAVLEEARAKWVAGGLKMKSARNYLQGSISAVFSTAVDVDRLVKINPCTKLKWPTKIVPEPDPFTLEERDLILTKLRQAPEGKIDRRKPPVDRWAYPLIALLFWTGMRPSEATGLFWGDVDLVAGRVFIRRSRVKGILGPPKTEASRRTIRLSAPAGALLASLRPLHPAEDAPVLTMPSGRPIEQERFSKTHWRTALSAAKVRPRRLYDTRCTFISLAVSGGVDLLWVSKQVGSSVTTLQKHYARYMPEAEEVQLMRLNEALRKRGGENGAAVAPATSEGSA